MTPKLRKLSAMTEHRRRLFGSACDEAAWQHGRALHWALLRGLTLEFSGRPVRGLLVTADVALRWNEGLGGLVDKREEL